MSPGRSHNPRPALASADGERVVLHVSGPLNDLEAAQLSLDLVRAAGQARARRAAREIDEFRTAKPGQRGVA